MTSRTINAMVAEGESIGRYVYAKTTESIITGTWQRIVKARKHNGNQQVKVLKTGRWVDLVDGGITLQ